MSQTLSINGIEFVPAGAAGKHFGYSRDYMLTLAREGKIDGQKIGHRWYINLASGEKYFSEAKVVREERKQQISYERKVELKSHEVVRSRASSHSVLLETTAVIAISVLIGVTGYIGVNPQTENRALAIEGDTSFFKQLAISLFNFISPRDTSVVTTQETNKVALEKTSGDDVSQKIDGEAIANGTTTFTSLVVAPDQVLTTTTVNSIRNSFSDDISVSIDPQNPDTGIIIPHFKDVDGKKNDGEAYRYLIVPVTEGDGS